MKKAYAASLYKNGLLGGGLYLDEEKAVFRTGKITVPARLRNLELYYNDIDKISKGSILLLPAVTFNMKNGEEWRFVVFGCNDFIKNIGHFVSVK